MDFPQKKWLAKILVLISFLILSLGMVLLNSAIKKTKQGQPRAETPFFGCVSAGEWLCACDVPNVGWQALECSLLEDTEGKQKWIDRCGGDAVKAKTQWLWDMATRDGRVDPTCCGGQNVCPAPTKQPPPASQATETIVLPPGLPPGLPPVENLEQETSLPPQPRVQPTFEFQNPKTFTPETSLPKEPVVPQFIVPEINLPEFKLPRFQININTQKINQVASAPLGFFESISNKIIYYDSLLENYINEKVRIFFDKSTNRL